MRIFLNNIEIPITDDLEIQASILSPLFNVNDGSYLFNFTVPGTDTLYKALGWKHRMNTPRPIDVPFRLEQGSISMNATAIVTQCDYDSYEISAGIGKGDFNYLIKDLKLKDPDIDWGTLTPCFFTETTPQDISLSNNYSSAHWFDIVFETLVAGMNSFTTDGISYVSTENLTYRAHLLISNIQISKILPSSSDPTANIQMYKYVPGTGATQLVNHVLSNSLDASFEIDVLLNIGESIHYGLYLSENCHIDIGSIQLIILEKLTDEIINSYSNSYPNNSFVFFPVHNDSLFDNINNTTLKDNYANCNVINPLNYEYSLMWSGPNKNNVAVNICKIYIPFLFVGYVLKNIVEYFGYTLKDDFFINSEWAQLALINFYVDYNFNFSGSNVPFILPNQNMELKNQLPDMLISDFINSLAIVTGCVIDVNINTKELTFKPVSPIIKSKKSIDWNSKYSHSLSKFDSLYNGFELKYENQNDNFISNNFKSVDFINILGFNYLGRFSDFNITGTRNLNDVFYHSVDKIYFVWSFDTVNNVIGWINYSKDFIFSILQNNIDKKTNNLFTLSSKLVPLMRSEPSILNIIPGGTNASWIIPITKQAGHFKYAMETWDVAQMPGIVFFRGMYLDGTDNYYPFADNSINDFHGNEIGDLSLRLDNKGGLLERWQDFLDFILACRQLEIFKDLDEIDIIKLAFDKKIMIEGKLVLLSEVKFKLSAKGVDVDEIWGFC